MFSLIECSGYEPDEFRSLLSWMLRDRTVIPDDRERFYWYDRLKVLSMKNAHLLLKSLVEDHAAVPVEVIEKVVDFIEKRPACRDPYVAVLLMDDISRLHVDRNSFRAYSLAMRDDGMTRLEFKEEGGDRVEEEDSELAHALDEFRRVLNAASGAARRLSEEQARIMGMHAIRVHQWCKKHKYPSLRQESEERLSEIPELRSLGHKSAMALLWLDLFEYAAQHVANETTRKRLTLIARAGAIVTDKQWSSVDVMMVLWAIYSLMEVGSMPNPRGLTFLEVVDCILRSRKVTLRLPIPEFAVDKNTVRGRKAVDTTQKFMTLTRSKPFLSEAELCKKYDPIEASHGKSPHGAKQTSSDYKKRVEECESRLSFKEVTRFFENWNERDRNAQDEGQESEEGRIRRLQRREWRAVLQFASPDPLEETVVSTLPKAYNENKFLDFDTKVTYSGPWSAKEALRAFCISRLARRWAHLNTVPEIGLRLNANKTKIFIEEPLIGERPALPQDAVKLEQRSLYPMKSRKAMENLTEERKFDAIKTFVFRRITGMACLPTKCLAEEPTGKIYMTDLQSSPKEYRRCQQTVKSGSAYWLFDCSKYRGVIEFVSDALENEERTRREVMQWLEGLNRTNLPDAVIPEALCQFSIPYQDLHENLCAVIDAYLPLDVDVDVESGLEDD